MHLKLLLTTLLPPIALLFLTTPIFALATPSADPSAAAVHEFCNRPGEPCFKVKRAAEAVAAALAEPAAVPNPVADPAAAAAHTACYRPGEPCFKAKRDAAALADAVADAHAAALPEPNAGMFSS